MWKNGRPSVPLCDVFRPLLQTALRIFPMFDMSVEDNRAHCLSKSVFQKKFLIQDYRGLSVQKRWFFLLLWTLLKTALRIFPIFCISVENDRAHCLSKIFFQKRILIQDYRGLSVQKRCFLLLWPLLQVALRIFSIFYMSIEDNRAHCLGKIVFQKEILIPDYRGLGVMDMDVFAALALYY